MAPMKSTAVIFSFSLDFQIHCLLQNNYHSILTFKTSNYIKALLHTTPQLASHTSTIACKVGVSTRIGCVTVPKTAFLEKMKEFACVVGGKMVWLVGGGVR